MGDPVQPARLGLQHPRLANGGFWSSCAACLDHARPARMFTVTAMMNMLKKNAITLCINAMRRR